MDRVLDLKPEVTQGCGFESRLRQEVHDCSPGAAQSAAHCFQVCTLGWVKCREHISLIILCIIVYVTNKAHPSLICKSIVFAVLFGVTSIISVTQTIFVWTLDSVWTNKTETFPSLETNLHQQRSKLLEISSAIFKTKIIRTPLSH